MNNKFYFNTAIAILVVFSSGFAQSLKSKNFNVGTPSYASIVKPKDIITYDVELALLSGEVLNFTRAELREKLVFEDFVKVAKDETPDIFFAISGISQKTLEVRGAYGPETDEMYSLKIIPKKKATIKIAVLVKGEVTHIWERGISYKVDASGTPQPYIINFSAEDKDKYLVILPHSDLPEISQYTIEKFLDISLGESYLENKLIPDLKNAYDISLNKVRAPFYFIKDKKNKEISNESKEKVELFKDYCQNNLKSLKYLREHKSEITPFVNYWESLLQNYSVEDKNSQKIVWGITLNLYQLNMLLENFDNATKYMNQAIAINHKKNYTKALAKDLKNTIELFNKNYNDGNLSRNFSAKYDKNELVRYISN